MITQNDIEFMNALFEELMSGNSSMLTLFNIQTLNSIAMTIYSMETLGKTEVEILRKIIMCCNVLYNRTDLNILPIEDGVYDLLLEKYKTYDPNFQVGSAVVEFKNDLQKSNPDRPVITEPIIFGEPVKKDEIHQMMSDEIMRKDKPIMDRYDFVESPISFESDYISKRSHNTQHNHPNLVGTLDKCKFVFIKDAVEAGCENDPNVKILERDFFQDHINKGLIRHDQEIEIIAELKYDGISVEADCTSELISARTRGDTGIGEASDITPILKGYPFKHAKAMIGEQPFGVKFEAIMTKSNLYKFNQLRNKNYSNSRTAIVGLFGASDAYEFRDLITLVPLALDMDDPRLQGMDRISEINLMNKLFRSHGEPLRYCYFKGNLQEVLFYIKAFWDEAIYARDYLDFMYDGIVLSYLDPKLRNQLGRKNYINKYSIAVKFNPLEKQTIFRGYTYEVGQNGQITPMIHYDPIEFIGTIHTKSTGSSLDRFNKLGLRYGDILTVKYVNDVMPYVSKTECQANRENQNPLIEFIKECPICGSKLITSESGKTAICPNLDCSGRSLQRMSNMMQKLNIKGFSDAFIAALGKTHLYELMHTDEDYMIEKIGQANGSALYETLHNVLIHNPVKDYIVMGALGFTGMAHKKWQSILQKISLNQIYETYKESKSDFEFRDKLLYLVPNIGDVTSNVIASELPYFEKDIIEIINNFNVISSYGQSNENTLQIRFTGCRNKQLSELLCNRGFDADDSSSVTKKTDILIIPYDGFRSNKTSKVSDKCLVVPIDQFQSNMEYYLTKAKS